MATRWTSKHTGQKIDDTIDYVCNPNLLDNWYFGNPVNQRGQTEYSAVGYTIDRWKAIANAFSTTITDEGISISGKQFQYILQNIENPERLNGKTVTISVLIKNPDGAVRINLHNQTTDVGLFKDFPASNGFTLVQYTTTPSISKGDIAFVGIYPGANNATDPRSCVVQAVKLELGSQQTLAHQDENGNWVLNEIPDYGEQLRRCQRYFIRLLGYPNHFAGSTGNGNNIEFFIPGISLRDTPAVSGLTNVSIRYSSGASNTTFTLTAIAARAHGVYISGNVGTLGNAAAYSVISVASSKEFSLSADL